MPPQLYRLNRALNLQKVGEKHRKIFSEQVPPPPNDPPPPPPPPPVGDQVQRLRQTSSFDSFSSSLSSLSFEDDRPISGSSAKFSFSTLLTIPSSIAESSTPSSTSTNPHATNSSGIIPISISPSITPAPFRPKPKLNFHKTADYAIPPESHKHSVLPLSSPHLITFDNLSIYHRHLYNIISTLEENTDAPSLDFIYHTQIRLIHRPYTEWFYSHEHTRSRFSTGNWRAEIRKGRVGDCPMTDGTAAIIAKECFEFIQLCEAWLDGAGKTIVANVLDGEDGEAKKKKNKEERWLVSWWRRDVEEVAAHLEASLETVNGGNVVPFKRLGGVL